MHLAMSSTWTRLSRRIALASFWALASCTAQTQDNFTNPPPGPPTSCTQVSALPGCGGGSLSYACASGRPDDGDANLVCDRGTAGVSSGSVSYCCAPYGQWASECAPAPALSGCGAQSLAFSCTGETSPDQVDPSLVCSSSLPGDGGGKDYCCVSFDQSSGICRCTSFDEGAGTCGAAASTSCSSGAIGFDCAGAHTPTEVNPLLACTVPEGGATGSYCCQTP